MIKIELQFTTVAEAVAFLAAGQAATGATGAAPAVVTEKPDTKPAKAEKPKAVAADPTPAATPVATPAATPPTAAAEPVAVQPQKALDYAVDVSPKIAQAAKHNRAAVVAALSRFNVAKGTELKPEQWPAFVAEMDSILAV
jgi:hypothetical protein